MFFSMLFAKTASASISRNGPLWAATQWFARRRHTTARSTVNLTFTCDDDVI